MWNKWNSIDCPTGLQAAWITRYVESINPAWHPHRNTSEFCPLSFIVLIYKTWSWYKEGVWVTCYYCPALSPACIHVRCGVNDIVTGLQQVFSLHVSLECKRVVKMLFVKHVEVKLSKIYGYKQHGTTAGGHAKGSCPQRVTGWQHTCSQGWKMADTDKRLCADPSFL